MPESGKDIVILEPDDYSSQALELYRSVGVVHLNNGHINRDASLLIVRLSYSLDREFLSQFERLRIIVTPTTGLDHIDLDACSEFGIEVVSLRDIPDAIVEVSSTAELAFGLLISLIRNIPRAHSELLTGQNRWSRSGLLGAELKGMRLGLIGYGRLGQQMAKYAKAFGMHVDGYDPHQSESIFQETGVNLVGLDSLLAESDVISLHAKFDKGTAAILGESQIRKMKKGACLVNTARGELVDEVALVKALESGALTGVAADVLCNESQLRLSGASPLLDASRQGHNVILTPHIGGYTKAALHFTEEAIASFVLRTYFEKGGGHG